jgi:hypothetical protein
MNHDIMYMELRPLRLMLMVIYGSGQNPALGIPTPLKYLHVPSCLPSFPRAINHDQALHISRSVPLSMLMIVVSQLTREAE